MNEDAVRLALKCAALTEALRRMVRDSGGCCHPDTCKCSSAQAERVLRDMGVSW